MLTWVIGIVVVAALLVVGGGSFFSVVPSRFRKADPASAEPIDESGQIPNAPVVISWHDSGFDKPR